MLFKLIKEQL